MNFLISSNSGDVEGTRTSTHSVPSPTDRPTGFVILGNRVFRNAIRCPWSKISEALTLNVFGHRLFHYRSAMIVAVLSVDEIRRGC